LDNIIRKISNFLSFILIFAFSGFFYFGYKGFTVDGNGNVVLKQTVAEAATYNGIATVLDDDISINATQKYAIGPVNAPLTLYEYSSLGCPHCADFHLDYLPKLEADYVAKGLLRVVMIHFPLDKQSMKGAMLAMCMDYENNKGFVNLLFNKQRSWWLASDDETLIRYAAEYGLSYDEAIDCMHNDVTAQGIIADRQQAISQLKIQGTPAFLFSGKDGNEIVYGLRKYDEIKEYLDNRLALLQ
jgi:protein-disulfide isomerase